MRTTSSFKIGATLFETKEVPVKGNRVTGTRPAYYVDGKKISREAFFNERRFAQDDAHRAAITAAADALHTSAGLMDERGDTVGAEYARLAETRARVAHIAH